MNFPLSNLKPSKDLPDEVVFDSKLTYYLDYNLSDILHLGSNAFYLANEHGDDSPKPYFESLNICVQYALATIIFMNYPLATINHIFHTKFPNVNKYLYFGKDIYIQDPVVVKILNKIGNHKINYGTRCYKLIEKIDTTPQNIKSLRHNSKELVSLFELMMPNKYFQLLKQPVLDTLFNE